MHRKPSILISLLTLCLLAGSSLLAMPPHPELLERIERGEIAMPHFLQNEAAIRTAGVNAPGQAVQFNPELDEIFNALVILVDFTDNVSSVEATFFDDLMFEDANGTVRDFYDEVSYGELEISTVDFPSDIAWVRAPETYAYYVDGQNGTGSYPQNSQGLVEDVVEAVDDVVDFGDYDHDGDGDVDGLFVVHAGPGAEYTGSDDDIWSHAWSLPWPGAQHDGVWVRRYSVEPEYWQNANDMTPGVYAHEMGHSVFGLPDVYDRDYTSSGLGNWSLMAGGSWNGTLGSSPAHPDLWCRMEMGYVDPINVTVDQIGLEIPAIQDTSVAYRLWTDGNPSNQYFLVENRQQTGYDAHLPGEGLLIYHVDDNVGSQNDNEWYPGHENQGHYLVALEQADGDWDLEQDVNRGDSGDPWPGSQNETDFNDASTPNSDSYAGATTDVAVENISASGMTMTADLIVGNEPFELPIPTNVQATLDDQIGEVSLTWDAVEPGDNTLEEYRVYLDGVLAGSTTETAFTDYLLDYDSYSYTVRAVYTEGQSGASDPATVNWSSPGTAHFEPVAPTGVWHTFEFSDADIDGVTLAEGDEIAIYDANVCVGAAVAPQAGFPVTVTAWGENIDEGRPGFDAGDQASFRMYRSNPGFLAPGDPTYTSGNGTFEAEGAAELSITYLSVPEQFGLISPSGTLQQENGDVELTWEEADDPDPSDAITYSVYASTTENDLGAPIAEGLTTTTHTMQGEDALTYYWSVKAVDGHSNERMADDTLSFTLQITQEGLPAFALLEPPNNSSVDTETPTLTWASTTSPHQDDPVSYTLYWSVDDPTFAEADSAHGLTDTTYTFTGDGFSHTDMVYWRVRAEAEQAGSRWATPQAGWVFTVALDATMPAFSLLSPDSAGASGLSNPVLSWEATSSPFPDDPVSYVAYWTVDDPTFADPDSAAGLTEATCTLPDGLSSGDVVYWRVRATADLAEDRWADPEAGWFFTMTENNPPGAFNLVAPPDSLTTGALEMTFGWEESIDPDPDDEVTYRLEVSTDEAFTDPVTVETGAEVTHTLTELADDTQYWWRVFAEDVAGHEVQSTQTRTFFTFVQEPPEAFSLLQPAPDAEIYLTDPWETTLVWQNSVDPDPGEETVFNLYLLVSRGDAEDTLITYAGLEDTALAVNLPDSLDYLPNWFYDLEVMWWVGASSGQHFVQCDDTFEFTLIPPVIVQENPFTGIPEEFGVEATYPNPFNPTVSVVVGLPETGRVTVEIYDALGRRADVLEPGRLAPGYHRLAWEANGPTGYYFLVVRDEQGHREVRKVLYMK